jgi:hypothetical protein
LLTASDRAAAASTRGILLQCEGPLSGAVAVSGLLCQVRRTAVSSAWQALTPALGVVSRRLVSAAMLVGRPRVPLPSPSDALSPPSPERELVADTRLLWHGDLFVGTQFGCTLYRMAENARSDAPPLEVEVVNTWGSLRMSGATISRALKIVSLLTRVRRDQVRGSAEVCPHPPLMLAVGTIREGVFAAFVADAPHRGGPEPWRGRHSGARGRRAAGRRRWWWWYACRPSPALVAGADPGVWRVQGGVRHRRSRRLAQEHCRRLPFPCLPTVRAASAVVAAVR